MTYPKRLIEVDLPIKRISSHARREKKSAGHGHLTTLHIWWARRPLAACRAVICASLWPDPADSTCPQAFRDGALKEMIAFAKATQINKELSEICSTESWNRYMTLASKGQLDLTNQKGQELLREYLLDFVADFASFEASTHKTFIETAQHLTNAAHISTSGEEGTRPLVLDPFAGGGSIPIEASRVGANAIATDLNPVAVVLNKVLLNYLPRMNSGLPQLLERWGTILQKEVADEFGSLYPAKPNGDSPIAYIWARTIRCYGPSCGAVLPLIRSLWLQKKGSRKASLRIVPDRTSKTVRFEVVSNPLTVDEGTVKRGSATCPCCGYTTPVSSVRKQLIKKEGGTRDSQCVAVVSSRAGVTGRYFSVPDTQDSSAAVKSEKMLADVENAIVSAEGRLPLSEELPLMSGVFNAPIYGINTWRLLYSPRQFLMLLALGRKIAELPGRPEVRSLAPDLGAALVTCLGLVHSKLADLANSLCNWEPNVPTVQHLFGRQAIQMSWDFAEGNILGESRGSWRLCLNSLVKVLEANAGLWAAGEAMQSDAAKHLLPNDSASAIITDPPYYNAVPYADLSDFFYSWLYRTIRPYHADLFAESAAPKAAEICEMSGWDARRYGHKDKAWFELKMTEALAEARRVLQPGGIAVVVFAHKSTAGWEAILQAVVNSGWVVTASWPIDTELETRLRGMKSAALSSSIHLVCRPRENRDGSLRTNVIGDWRDVLAELPKRVREWMARLSSEGVVGADAIFACLGPALEIFSRFSRVEKASGEQVLLKEYLTYVWGAVAQEALAQIFKDADAAGFEEDARLTAMWLWTLNAGSSAIADTGNEADEEAEETPEGDENEKSSGGKSSGYVLEFDAARKIAQGLGAHLEQLSAVIEVKGDKARLLSVGERTRKLFGKDEDDAPTTRRRKKDKQMKLFSLEEVEAEEGGWGKKSVPKLGDTVLDRVHQSMILFAAGRGEALKRFLVEDGAGQDQRFWKLANALSALYPQGTDEKRWVDGVLARKKGLGL